MAPWHMGEVTLSLKRVAHGGPTTGGWRPPGRGAGGTRVAGDGPGGLWTSFFGVTTNSYSSSPSSSLGLSPVGHGAWGMGGGAHGGQGMQGKQDRGHKV